MWIDGKTDSSYFEILWREEAEIKSPSMTAITGPLCLLTSDLIMLLTIYTKIYLSANSTKCCLPVIHDQYFMRFPVIGIK